MQNVLEKELHMKNGKTLKEGVRHEYPVEEEKAFEKKAFSHARRNDMPSNSTISACCIEKEARHLMHVKVREAGIFQFEGFSFL
jgi:hypothetical protein